MVENKNVRPIYHSYMYKKPANTKLLKPFRKQLRNHATMAECVLWRTLKESQIESLKFRRQHSIGSYILDFYCPMLKLGIELDGGIHNDMVIHMRDEEKEDFFKANSINVLRFPNEVVFNNPQYIIERIIAYKEEYLND